MCTAVLVETAHYYVSRNTDVFCCLLDAIKAFDKVHHGKLFNLLFKRNISPLVIHLLLDSYTRQEVQVSWDNEKSCSFSVKNGVKQRGVLSPILFIVYIDELILLLKDAGIGCHMGHSFVGASGYADDLTLISPSIRALNEMISICEKFASKYSVTFNTVCIKFGSSVLKHDKVYLCGSEIEWADHVKHLGNVVNKHLSD